MRLRHVKGAEELMETHPRVLLTGDEVYARARGRRLCLEVGAGKGGFILGMAARHPDDYFLGMERQASALVYGVKKLEAMEAPPENVDFFYADAEWIGEYIKEESVSGLYLNFSDPWPKKRHEGRRLTGRRFLQRFRPLLVPGGRLCFKTDNQELFSFSLEEVEESGFALVSVTRDLHRDRELLKDNVTTEYEERFVERGVPICRLVAEKKGS